MSFSPKVDLSRGTIEQGSRRLVLHCNHYNAFLQRTIEDGLGARAPGLLLASAMETARLMLSGLEDATPSGSFSICLTHAAELFAAQGFGQLDVQALAPMGGHATLAQSHYALGWLARWEKRKTPGCFYAAGYLASAVAIAGKLAQERIVVREDQCLAMGDAFCHFVVEVW